MRYSSVKKIITSDMIGQHALFPLSKFDKIMKGIYMDWNDKLKQDINATGGFLESEVEDLIMIVEDRIREIMIELVREDPRIMDFKNTHYNINKLLSERGIESI